MSANDCPGHGCMLAEGQPSNRTEDECRELVRRMAGALTEAGRPDLVRQLYVSPDHCTDRLVWMVIGKRFSTVGVVEGGDPQFIRGGRVFLKVPSEDERLMVKAGTVVGLYGGATGETEGER